MSGSPHRGQNLYSLTFHTHDAAGERVHVRDSIVGLTTYDLSREMTEAEAKAFNPWNLLHVAMNGTDDSWDPAGVRAQYEALGQPVFRMSVIAKKPAERADTSAASAFSTVTPANTSIRTGDPGVTYRASLFPAKADASEVHWSSPSPLVAFSAPSGQSVTVTGHNTGNRAEYVPVRATAADGFYVQGYIYVEPAYVPPPNFTKQPSVILSPGNARVSYELQLGGHDDQSRIAWLLCDDRSCNPSRAVAVSRGDTPLRRYSLTQAAIGKYVGRARGAETQHQ